jgi:CBS domain-containing protein
MTIMKRPLPERVINMRVRDVMTRNVRCCAPDTPVREAALLMRDGDCGAIPVIEPSSGQGEGRVIGIVTDRDIACRIVANDQNPLEMTVGACMSTPVITVRLDASLTECCTLMEQRKVRRVPVVDENGRCVGIVSQADIARHAPEARTGDLVQGISQPVA